MDRRDAHPPVTDLRVLALRRLTVLLEVLAGGGADSHLLADRHPLDAGGAVAPQRVVGPRFVEHVHDVRGQQLGEQGLEALVVERVVARPCAVVLQRLCGRRRRGERGDGVELDGVEAGPELAVMADGLEAPLGDPEAQRRVQHDLGVSRERSRDLGPVDWHWLGAGGRRVAGGQQPDAVQHADRLCHIVDVEAEVGGQVGRELVDPGGGATGQGLKHAELGEGHGDRPLVAPGREHDVAGEGGDHRVRGQTPHPVSWVTGCHCERPSVPCQVAQRVPVGRGLRCRRIEPGGSRAIRGPS